MDIHPIYPSHQKPTKLQLWSLVPLAVVMFALGFLVSSQGNLQVMIDAFKF